MSDTIQAYDLQASALAERYESVPAEAVHAALAEFIPQGQGLIALDVGAGSGRDAAWLVSLGYDVVAVEPASGMRREAQRRHPDPRIRWLDDRLPDLIGTQRLGITFDLILLSAVWMHVPPTARSRAFRKLVTLLKPGGVIIVSLREGLTEPDRPMWPAPSGEVEAFARTHGLSVLMSVKTDDQLGRSEIRWTSMCLRLPDDGAGALPLLRGIILNDDKSSTYKLGLLRAVARVADTTPGLALPRVDEDAVDIPLGMVALNWIRMYLPLVQAGLPQRPRNSGPDGIGFAKAGFRALMTLDVIGQDLRIGAKFAGERAEAVARALSESTHTIAVMPANFTRFPNSDMKVFEATKATPRLAGRNLFLDSELLATFGSLTVPGHVWRTLQRLGSWVEPVLVAEWGRLVREYAGRMGSLVPFGQVESALAWLDPVRDTQLARAAARRVLESGQPVTCVWSGELLRPDKLDIDHCFPWAAWPCGDLWNLLPASRRVNQHLKRDRLPSASVLSNARESIASWWEIAWLSDINYQDRFERETAAALPVVAHASVDEVFTAVQWRRLRLRQDQQVQEWAGIRAEADS